MLEGHDAMLIDTTDFTDLSFWFPKKLRMNVSMETEVYPNATRTGVVRWWTLSGMRLQLDLVFMHKVSTPMLDVERKVRWIRERCGPTLLGDLIVAPPRQFLCDMGPLVPRGVLWEIEDGFDLETDGIFSTANGMVPPRANVRLSLIKADSGWG